AISLGERLEAGALNRAEVHENVWPPFPRDEAVPLCVVEPLHGACQTWHCTFPFLKAVVVSPGVLKRTASFGRQGLVVSRTRTGSRKRAQVLCTPRPRPLPSRLVSARPGAGGAVVIRIVGRWIVRRSRSGRARDIAGYSAAGLAA